VTSPAAGFARVIGWPVTIAAIAYLVLLGGAYPGVFAPAFRIVDVVVAAVALAIWAALMVVDPRWRPATVLWPAILATLVVFALSTVTSKLTRFSAEYLAYAIVLWALYLLLVRLQAHPFIGARLNSVAVVLLAIIAGLYLFDTVSIWQTWWSIVGRVTIPPLRPGFESLAFGNPSALGAVSVLLFVTGAAHIGWSTRGRVAAVALLGLVTLTVCLVTGARSVWLGVVGMVFVLVVLWASSRDRRAALAAALRSGRVRVALVGAVAVAVVAVVVAAPGVLIRAGFGDPYRPGYWLASMRMFGDRPLSGQGLGLWAAERATFTASTEPDFYIPHGHNVYLQTLAELGVLGVLAAVVIIWVVGRLIRRSLAGTPEQNRYAWAAIAAIAYLAAHQIVDVVTNLPAVLFALALPISRLDALALGEREPGRWGAGAGAGIAAVVAAVVGIAMAMLFWTTSTAVTHQRAVDAANDGHWQEALGIANEAVVADPDMPAYQVTLGLALARAGENDAAEAALRRAAEVDDLPQSWLDIAALDVAAGRSDAARGALDRAMRLGMQQAGVAFPAALLYAKLGDADEAADALARALEAAPSIAADPWWGRHPELAAIRAAAVERTVAVGGEDGFRVALETGRLEDASTALATFESDPTLHRLVIAAWSGGPEARRQLELLASAQPLDLEAVTWNAVLADHLGDVAGRNRYRAWAEVINGGAGWEAVGYRIVDALAAGQGPTGTLGLSYGQYLYLRPIPRDELIAGLPQLVYR
jgi:tetratricopeptide (TPR) repeat protein